MCMLCMLYHCASDMTAVMQSAAPIGGTPAHSGTTSAITDVVIVHKTVLSYPQSKGKLVVFG